MAGIGSRQTPYEVLDVMYDFGAFIARNKGILRSGGAKGADQAFIRGACGCDESRVEVYLPWAGYECRHFPKCCVKLETPDVGAYTIAKAYHPAWIQCDTAARKFHARNMHIIFGKDLNDPVDLVICWTPNGLGGGGTGQGMRAAMAYGIDVVDLACTSAERVAKMLKALFR